MELAALAGGAGVGLLVLLIRYVIYIINERKAINFNYTTDYHKSQMPKKNKNIPTKNTKKTVDNIFSITFTKKYIFF